MKPRVLSLGSIFSLYRVPQAWFNFISVHLGLRVDVCSLLFGFILSLDFSFSLFRSLDGSEARDGDL